MKEKINLDKIALIGRTYAEYEKIFRLKDFVSSKYKILDAGSGVSSFCAEASQIGMNIIAMDPIYIYEPDELEVKCSKDLDLVIKELDGVEHLYIWDNFRNKEDLKKNREKAYKTFINHYKKNKDTHYVAESMPKTKFKDNQFDVILASHLLFLYDHIFDYDFHKNTIVEMLRICSKEIRIFPLVNLYGNKSKFFKKLLDDTHFKDKEKSVERVNYEFIKGGNEILRIIKDN